MKYIHKIIFITILTIISVPSYAGIQMCSKDDTVTVVLDASLELTETASYKNISAWKAKLFHSGTSNRAGVIQGRSACLADKDNNSGYNGNTYDVLTNNNGEVIVAGGGSDGGVCCCRITHPIMSKWYCINHDYNCSNNCPGHCASLSGNARAQLFNSAN